MTDPIGPWYCLIAGQQYGPISEAELRAWVQQRRITPTDLVWAEGMSTWQPLQAVQNRFAQPVPLPPALRPHRGILILVLGIVSIFVSFLGIMGGITWHLANQDLPEMDAGRMDPAGRGMTQAGKVCGIIGFAFGMLGCCWMTIWLAIVLGGLGFAAF